MSLKENGFSLYSLQEISVETLEEALQDYDVVPGEECRNMRKFLREVNITQGEATRIVAIAWKMIQVVNAFFIRDERRT